MTFGVFAAGFAPRHINVGLRIQHVNVIFAFQRYLHGFVFIFQTPPRGKLTVSQQIGNILNWDARCYSGRLSAAVSPVVFTVQCQ